MGKPGPRKGAPNAGAPKTYTAEQIEAAIMTMSEGNTLKQAADSIGMSYAQINQRINKSDDLQVVYARAREEYSHYRVAQLNEIAADKSIESHRARLMCDNIKWEVAKVIPKFYGDKQQIDVNDITKRDTGELKSRLAKLLGAK